MKYVFISYKSENEASAQALRNVLEQNGIHTWMSCHDVAPGKDFSAEIMSAIEGCFAFVLLLTPQAQKSTWIENEVKSAINCNKPLFPVQLSQVTLTPSFKYLLSSSQIVTLSQIGGADPSTQRFLAAIKACMNGAPLSNRLLTPTKRRSHLQWVIVAVVAVILVTVIGVSISLSKKLSDFNLNLGHFTMPQLSGQATLPTADPSATNQILECHQDEVLSLKYQDNPRTIYVKVGGTIAIDTAWSDYILYSEDTGIARCEGVLIKGVSPGVTYVVMATSEHVANAYRVIVEE